MANGAQKTVIITGSAGGVGSAAVGNALAAGYRVIGTVANADEKRRLLSRHPEAQVEIVDLSDAMAGEARFREILADDGTTLAAAIGCAGMALAGPVEALDIAALRRMCEINAFANVALFRASFDKLRAAGGRLIVTSSYSGKISLPFMGYYSASKFCLEGLADAIRQEAKPFGIDVVIIIPGAVKTPLISGQITQMARDLPLLAADVRERHQRMYGIQKSLLEGVDGTGIEPELVGRKIVEVIAVANPALRYCVGEDAEAMIAMRRSMDDAAIDEIVAREYAKAAT